MRIWVVQKVVGKGWPWACGISCLVHCPVAVCAFHSSFHKWRICLLILYWKVFGFCRYRWDGIVGTDGMVGPSKPIPCAQMANFNATFQREKKGGKIQNRNNSV